jgi:hypothetical protein
LDPINEADDDTLRAWLLHRLADESAVAALEQRVLEDDAFGLRVRAIETDLIDDYARGRLDDDDRRAVARWLIATPADRLRLRTARALAHLIGTRGAARATRSNAPARRRRGLFAFAAAAVLLLAVWGTWQRTGRDAPIGTDANLPTITLLASQQRGAAGSPNATVGIAHDASALRLQVEVAEGDASTRYAVRIDSASGTVFEARALAARTNGAYRFVEAVLASNRLADGDYRVRVAVDGSGQPLQEWTLRTHRD